MIVSRVNESVVVFCVFCCIFDLVTNVIAGVLDYSSLVPPQQHSMHRLIQWMLALDDWLVTVANMNVHFHAHNVDLT